MHIYLRTDYGTHVRMDSKQIRKIRLKQLIAREKADGGSQASLARKVETDPAYLSQILGKEERDVGDDLARRLETACDLPHGWMDSFGEGGSEVSSEAMELALLIDDLPEAQRAALKATAEAFRKAK